MIVISGALVLVALVLLIIGVVGPDLTFVYASIGVSLVSLVFLVVGILQRRGETAPAADGAAAPAPTPATAPDAEGVTAVVPAQSSRPSSRRLTPEPATEAPEADEPVAAEPVAEELATGGTVLVVEGRPRYHVSGCRYLSGKTAESVDVLDAREEGFTPCGVCKPDDALAAIEQTAPLALEPVGDPAEEPVVEEDVPDVEAEPAAARTTKPAKTSARKAPARTAKVPAKTASATAPTGKAAARKAPATVKPSKAALAAAAATPAAAGAKRAGSVVVIPDRGKYHRAECRYVRDVPEAEVMSKTAAGRQGYAACGVCKP